MPLVTLKDLSIRFRGPPLLDEVNCRMETGERIGLLGRNGAGKSTLMKLISGDVESDSGEVIIEPGARVATLKQDVPGDITGSIASVVQGGVPAEDATDENAWRGEQNVKRVLQETGLDGEAEFAALSSGMKRRVLLARALVSQPSLLLLDEPTNHLDIASIAWLEEFLLTRYKGALLFVTHDRMFLQRLATRIIELERGRLFDWSCNYDDFQKRKAAVLAAEEKQNADFDRKLAQEEVWIRQGIKARRTRNEGRVRALQKMRRERAERRNQTGNVRMQVQQGARSGNLVVAAEDAGFAYNADQEDQFDVFHDLTTLIERGDKIGLIGPNGAGKTTLLKVLLGKLQPTAGKVRQGANLEVAYFDQLREQLDPDKSVADNVTDGSDKVQIGDKSKHVIGYLQDFLFTPQQARGEVRFLSGGERNRLLLARLFTRPANVLVLDEPTNDLDAETLDLLEELLASYEGTVLLVSHDRAFLNNVVSSTLVFEGDGAIKEYAGGYDDYIRQSAPAREEAPQAEKKSKKPKPKPAPQAAEKKAKLSFKEQRELDSLPETIEKLEADIAALHEKMADPNFYKQDGATVAAATAEATSLQQQLDTSYARWEELEERTT